jgi:hypothetical protein
MQKFFLQQYRHKADIRGTATIWSLLDKSGHRTGIASINDRDTTRRAPAHRWRACCLAMEGPGVMLGLFSFWQRKKRNRSGPSHAPNNCIGQLNAAGRPYAAPSIKTRLEAESPGSTAWGLGGNK